MKLDAQDLHAFQTLYQQEFGDVLSDDEVRTIFSGLVTLYERLACPLPDERSSLASSNQRAILENDLEGQVQRSEIH